MMLIIGIVMGAVYWGAKAFMFQNAVTGITNWQLKRCERLKLPLPERTFDEKIHRSIACLITIDFVWGAIAGKLFFMAPGQLALIGMVTFTLMSSVYIYYYKKKYQLIDWNTNRKKKKKEKTIEEDICLNSSGLSWEQSLR